jgi:hypothetical protein
VTQLGECDSKRGAALGIVKHAPTSDSAAEATTFLMTAATLRIDRLSVSCSGDLLPRKNRHPRRLRALETER